MKLAGRTQSINFKGMILGGLFLSLLLPACAPWRYQRLAKLPVIVTEASGLHIASGDTCWWLNDSGGEATIYSTDLKGRFLDSMIIPGATNVDWEEITTDTSGHFYLCDFGNNGNARRDLLIYKWKPGMRQAEQIHFSYPDQLSFPPTRENSNYDAEACFWFGDSLYIFSKNRIRDGNYLTRLYALPDKAGTYVAVLKDSLHLEDRVVTAATIRADGQEVGLLTYDYGRNKIWPFKASIIWLHDFPKRQFLRGRMERQEIPPTGLGKQFESADYLPNGDLIIASEAMGPFAPFLARLKRR